MKSIKKYDPNLEYWFSVPIGEIGLVEKEFENIILDDVEEELGIKLSSKQKAVRDSLQEFILLDSEQWACIMIGSCGNGKTMLGSAAVNSWNSKVFKSEYAPKAYYTTLSNIYLKARGFKEQEAIDTYCEEGLLFIDELDSSIWNETTQFVMGEIVNYFYNHRNNSRLILAGNITPDDFSKMLTARMADRLKNAKRIAMSEGSYRKRT